MKLAVLIALIGFSAAALADDLPFDAMHLGALSCLAHAIPKKDGWGYAADLDSPQAYEPGFGSCAALVSRWIDLANKRDAEEKANRKAREAVQEAMRKAGDIATINKGLQAAGLPLIRAE